ncbi:hypothetical protein [Stieleria varia]|uniref:Uncharacterized protein n=1 Tax=Stieleria varia TaxID=2528005 RepID=A0A5C6ALQ6_9BACT|nr:hypothetical protein [Stieleria varia]TWU00955.1 hypothetical protein Pla52n_43250 [Stieleria varia]
MSKTKQTTPEIDAILSELTHVAKEAFEGGTLDSDRVDKLTQSLSVNGWKRHSSDAPPLEDQVRERVLASLDSRGTSHESELSAIVGKIQQSYDSQTDSQTPASNQTAPT